MRPGETPDGIVDERPVAFKDSTEQVWAVLEDFDIEDARLKSKHRGFLDKAIKILRKNRRRIALFGHTSVTGNNAINDPLSERRAAAVHDFLILHGLPATQILFHRGTGALIAQQKHHTGEDAVDRNVTLVLEPG